MMFMCVICGVGIKKPLRRFCSLVGLVSRGRGILSPTTKPMGTIQITISYIWFAMKIKGSSYCGRSGVRT